MDNGILQLAFNIYNNPGVYSLLLGAGLSQSAEILTGWEIVGDLIRQIAFTLGENPQDPYEWYRVQYGEEPRYDTLLEKLAPAPTERNAILRPYFEPTEDERERGAKLPTEAHRAIASLIKSGYIRVILTTNFDRLLEMALGEIGIVPDVLSSDDMLQGRTPLRHSPITIVKLHGDYRDWRSLNSEEELSNYSDPKIQILDEIFNDYGLIICGWSARWDVALRNTLYRASARRYTTYWAAHGEISDAAKNLIQHRRAQVITIENADSFFIEIDRTIDAISKSKRADPMSMTVLVERVKKLIPRPESQIELDDLLRTVMRQAFDASVSKDILDRRKVFLDGSEAAKPFENIPPLYFEVVESLIHVMTALGWYGNETFTNYFIQAINQWTESYFFNSAHHNVWISFPITSLIYACGIAAVARDKLYLIEPLLVDPFMRTTPLLNAKKISFLDKTREEIWIPIIRSTKPANWLSLYLEQQLRPVFQTYIPVDTTYSNAFDLFETLLAVFYLKTTVDGKDFHGWMPPHIAVTSSRSWDSIKEFWRKLGKISRLRPEDCPLLFANLESALEEYQAIFPDFQKRSATFFIGTPDYLSEYLAGKTG